MPTKYLAELYSSFNGYRFAFQLVLGLLLIAYVIYVISLFPLNDDTDNAQPLPVALRSFEQWLYVFPAFTALIILYTQFAFTLNRRSCMSPLFWIVFVIFILALTGDFVYLFYLWLTGCKGVVDLVTAPDRGYCSTGTEVRWQFLFTFWTIGVMWVLAILTAWLMQMIFDMAKRIKRLDNDAAVEGDPLNSIDKNNQIGHNYTGAVSRAEHFADLFTLELLRSKGVY